MSNLNYFYKEANTLGSVVDAIKSILGDNTKTNLVGVADDPNARGFRESIQTTETDPSGQEKVTYKDKNEINIVEPKVKQDLGSDIGQSASLVLEALDRIREFGNLNVAINDITEDIMSKYQQAGKDLETIDKDFTKLPALAHLIGHEVGHGIPGGQSNQAPPGEDKAEQKGEEYEKKFIEETKTKYNITKAIENFKKITEALKNINTEFSNLASNDIETLIKLANDLDKKGEVELASEIDNILFRNFGDK